MYITSLEIAPPDLLQAQRVVQAVIAGDREGAAGAPHSALFCLQLGPPAYPLFALPCDRGDDDRWPLWPQVEQALVTPRLKSGAPSQRQEGFRLRVRVLALCTRS